MILTQEISTPCIANKVLANGESLCCRVAKRILRHVMWYWCETTCIQRPFIHRHSRCGHHHLDYPMFYKEKIWLSGWCPVFVISGLSRRTVFISCVITPLVQKARLHQKRDTINYVRLLVNCSPQQSVGISLVTNLDQVINDTFVRPTISRVGGTTWGFQTLWTAR
jgi:hypothetical protein